MTEQAGLTEFQKTLDGFMSKRGIDNLDELTAAMRTETGAKFEVDEIRAILDNPQEADAAFLYAVAVALKLSDEEVSAMTRALRVDVEAYLKMLELETEAP